MFSSSKVLLTNPTKYSWNKVGTTIYGDSKYDLCGAVSVLSRDGKSFATWLSGNFENKGKVRIYRLNGSSWEKKGQDISNTFSSTGMAIGNITMSGDGDTIAVSQFTYDPPGYPNGQVDVYKWSGSSWVKRGTPIQFQNLAYSSLSLNLDGSVVSIGSSDTDPPSVPNPDPNDPSNYYLMGGVTRTYSWNGSAWVKRGSDISGTSGDQTGSRVHLNDSGNTLVVGSYGKQSMSVYDWSGSSWTKRGSEMACTGIHASIDAAGNSVATMTTDDKTRIYSWNGSAWVQKGPDIVHPKASFLGPDSWSVALSGDGNTVAVGSPFYFIDYDTLGGKTDVYKWDGSSWIKMGLIEKGEGLGNDVSISRDGNTVLVCEPLATGFVWQCGKNYVYEWGAEKSSVLFTRW